MFDNFLTLVGEDIETAGWQDTMAYAMTEVFNMNYKLCLAVRSLVGSRSSTLSAPWLTFGGAARDSDDQNAPNARRFVPSHLDGKASSNMSSGC